MFLWEPQHLVMLRFFCTLSEVDVDNVTIGRLYFNSNILHLFLPASGSRQQANGVLTLAGSSARYLGRTAQSTTGG